jgi:hypothetical protein
MYRRRLFWSGMGAGLCSIIVLAVVFVRPAGATQKIRLSSGPKPEVQQAVHFDVSLPLRHLQSQHQSSGVQRDRPLRITHAAPGNPVVDPVLQSSAGPTVSTIPGLSFAGIGDTSNTPANPCGCVPSDTNGAAGATQYVQFVNTAFAVYDKSNGNLIMGPVAGNTLWSGFGGGCQTNNDGDIIAQYDKAANRWVLTQFSVSTTPFLQCVAVSTSSDATGSYFRYAFQEPNFNDYPKLGIWPDGYYFSFNIFNGNTLVGPRACSFDRSAMLSGAAATQVCFQLGSSFGTLLPSDLDGATAPPAGEPDFYMDFGTNSLNLWKFHVDFATPSNSTFTGPTNIPVAPFSEACGGRACIPQPGTNAKLDSLGDRLMYRLAYRNFGTHESLVVNHSVTVGSKKGASVGVRWYEIRDPNGIPAVYQQGTFAPDSNFRWMGSIAMDEVGDIALGYSLSSSSVFPSIAYTGRVPGDPLGTMEGENIVINGGGSQVRSFTRWGDYSAMVIDPVDDCTFWFTTEYIASTGSFNWSTQIISFKFPGCK